MLAAAVLLTGLAAEARAETLAELVKREEGIELGPCTLAPRPDVAGETIHLVVPARFETPGIWLTRSILFVGVDASGTVAGVAEAKALHDIAPREVISATCSKDRLAIRMSNRMSPATLSYVWTGKALTRAGRK